MARDLNNDGGTAAVKRLDWEDEAIITPIGPADKKGPYGCKCQSLAHHMTGDGCDECNPELAAELSKCEVESCNDKAEYYDETGNSICKEHMEQDIEETGNSPSDYETID